MRDPELTIPEHRDLVEALAQPLPAVEAPLESCAGAVLAEDVRAAVPVPPFTNSAMDGFALRFDDIAGLAAPVALPVLGDIPAGDAAPRECRPGAAWRIMTGAPMPDGADTVVRVEATDHSPGVAEAPATVTISRLPERGADVRHRGEAVEPGDLVVRAGAVLRGQELAAAASVGHGALRVHPRPRVLIVTTGAELAAAGDGLAHGQIPDSNGFLLRGLVEEAGGAVAAHLRTGDSPGQLRDALDRAPQADLVITAGGISQGAHEVVRRALGADAGFHRVAQQPGGPQGVGRTHVGDGEAPVICLPGNPVSVFVSFHVYVARALAVMAHRLPKRRGITAPRTAPAVAAASWRSPRGKTQFIPLRAASADEAGAAGLSAPSAAPPVPPAALPVVPVHALGSRSHLVASLPGADFIGVVPPATTRVCPGDQLDVIDCSHRDGAAGGRAMTAFTHLDESGAARMVDVTAKQPTVREASASARVDVSPRVMGALRTGAVPKGDVLAVARIAGIGAAKRVPDLLPLAHTIGVHGCEVGLSLEEDHVAITATVRTADRTGVEMEALTSVTVAALAVIDMVKGVDRSARIRDAKITRKSGGRSGEWVRPAD